jgi:hypothetical protein
MDMDMIEFRRENYHGILPYLRSPYHCAVDGRPWTAWQSRDVIRHQDYIGLDLLLRVDMPLRFTVVADHEKSWFDESHLYIELSTDDETYIPQHPRPRFRCKTRMNPQYLMEYDPDEKERSPEEQQDDMTSILSANQIRRASLVVQHCSFVISKEHLSKHAALAQGFRFIRLRTVKATGFDFPYWIHDFRVEPA